MFAFLLIVQSLVAITLVGVILMQRSEGGGLGVGGSSSGFMTARGAADFLTRSTSILGGIFIVLSIVMAAIAGVTRTPTKIDTSLANSAAPIERSQPAQPVPAAPQRPSSRTSRRPRFRSPNNGHFKLFSRRGLASGALNPVSLNSHGAVHFCHRRRGFIAWERSPFSVPRGASSGARLQGPDPQVRSLSERRSGDDVALSARRSLCDRRRGGDRPRPWPLRALHRRFVEAVGQCDHGPHLSRYHREGAARRLSRRDGPGHPARHQRDQGIRAQRHRRARFRHLRDRRHRRRHRKPAVHRIDPPAPQRPWPRQHRQRPHDAGAVDRGGGRAQDQADAAVGAGACRASASSRTCCCAAATGRCPRASARRSPCSATCPSRR